MSKNDTKKRNTCTNYSQELISYLDELYKINISERCSDTETKQLINDALHECGTNCDLSALAKIVFREDKIIPAFDSERLECIYNRFIGPSDNYIFCTSFANFMGDRPHADLYLQNGFIGQATAFTDYISPTPTYPNGYYRIVFNTALLEDYCDVTLVGTFYHEIIHTDILLSLNDPNININDYHAAFEGYRNANDHDHEYMANLYIVHIINALESIFGDQYTTEQYTSIAWAGLGEREKNDGSIEVISQAWLGLTQADRDNIKSTFESLNENCNSPCEN